MKTSIEELKDIRQLVKITSKIKDEKEKEYMQELAKINNIQHRCNHDIIVGFGQDKSVDLYDLHNVCKAECLFCGRQFTYATDEICNDKFYKDYKNQIIDVSTFLDLSRIRSDSFFNNTMKKLRREVDSYLDLTYPHDKLIKQIVRNIFEEEYNKKYNKRLNKKPE